MRKIIALAKYVGYIAACFTAGVYVGEGISSYIQKANSVVKTLLVTVGGIGTIAFLGYNVSHCNLCDNIVNEVADAFTYQDFDSKEETD